MSTFICRLRIFCLLFFAVLTSNAQIAHKDLSVLQQTIDEFRNKWAPDKRSSIVEVLPNTGRPTLIRISDVKLKPILAEVLAKLGDKYTIQTLPDSSVGAKTVGIINLSVANLRTEPSHAAEMATQVLLGSKVDILQKEAGNYRVRTAEGYIAWTPTSSVSVMTEDESKVWTEAERIIYTNEFGKSFSQAALESQRVSDLVYGDILHLLDTGSEYYHVAYPDGREAYVRKSEAQLFTTWLKTRKADAEHILKSARSMLGLPYLWGGTSVKGVDCSGFTKTSFFMNGLVIPRDASQQVRHGQVIDILDNLGEFDADKALKNLRPADLLFFAGGKNKNANARVTHVALYIGNGQFIHAAGTVRINSMLKEAADYDDFQTRTVVAARRYLGNHDASIQPIGSSNYYK